jgi:hypothetical protein
LVFNSVAAPCACSADDEKVALYLSYEPKPSSDDSFLARGGDIIEVQVVSRVNDHGFGQIPVYASFQKGNIT